MQKHIPNIISIFRIFLVAVFAVAFIGYYPESVPFAVSVFILSGISDVADGLLARKFGWTSDLGRVLDPVADKLMQVTALFCLSLKGVAPWWLFAFFLVKEGMMIVGALVLFKKRNVIYGSKIFGKIAAVSFYAIVVTIILFGEKLGTVFVNVLCIVAALIAVTALVLYIFAYVRKKNDADSDESAVEVK